MNEMGLKKIVAIIFLGIGLFPFYSSYTWFYFIRDGRVPRRQSGKYHLIYLAISILFVFIGLRLFLGPPSKKKKEGFVEDLEPEYILQRINSHLYSSKPKEEMRDAHTPLKIDLDTLPMSEMSYKSRPREIPKHESEHDIKENMVSQPVDFSPMYDDTYDFSP